MPADDIIICRDIHKWYGSYHALRGITTRIKRGQTVAITGGSGSGKSTFLRTINHLENHQRGDIIVDGVLLNADTRNIDAVRRNIGMVSQRLNLFPHLSVQSNVTLALTRAGGMNQKKAEAEAMELLERVGIAGQAPNRPPQLSRGQQQRAAIARALAMKPGIMLLDEPTSALDPGMVREVQEVVRELASSHMTLLLVTHDMSFARETADRIILLDEGQIVEDRPPDLFFNRPRQQRTKAFLARLLGLERL